MSEINDIIMKMILEKATVNEIVKATGSSHKQLFYRLNMLRTKGYDFKKKYYNNGEITYKINRTIETSDDKGVILFTSHKEKSLTAMLISDLHTCNEYDRLDLLYELYELCIKHNIHIILNGGDLIDGLFGPDNKRFDTYEQQINYLLKMYPYDKNIINFVCLGNHDFDSLKAKGQDLKNILSIKRHDIVPIGYGFGIINIKNDQIIMKHPKTPTLTEISDLKHKLILSGHYHQVQTSNIDDNVYIFLPSLSDIGRNEFGSLPGAIKMTINFSSNGLFKDATFEQYIFADKMYKVGEYNYDLSIGKDMINNNSIKYEEELPPFEKTEQKVKKI